MEATYTFAATQPRRGRKVALRKFWLGLAEERRLEGFHHVPAGISEGELVGVGRAAAESSYNPKEAFISELITSKGIRAKAKSAAAIRLYQYQDGYRGWLLACYGSLAEAIATRKERFTFTKSAQAK